MKIARCILLAIVIGFAGTAGARDRIFFSGDASPVRSQLFVANGDGTRERPLLPLTGMDYSPSFSADSFLLRLR